MALTVKIAWALFTFELDLYFIMIYTDANFESDQSLQKVINGS